METEAFSTPETFGYQAIPVVLAVLVVICGLFLPLADSTYIPAYVLAIVFSLATPLAFWIVAPRRLFRQSRAYRWLFIATIFAALCAAVTSGLLLSMGSPAGAAADIGGFPLWLLSTGALITATSLASRVRNLGQIEPSSLRGLQAKNPEQGEGATLRGLQRRVRRELRGKRG